MKEYKIVTVEEGMFSNLFFGNSKIPTEKIVETLNNEAQDGWELKFQVIEQKRSLLFSSVENVILTLEREMR